VELHPENLKPFKKGDPRINRKGRPKNFDALRKLAQEIGNEVDPADTKLRTTIETILRNWAKCKVPVLQKSFVEIAYGKVPDIVNVNEKTTIKVTVKHEDD